MNVFIIAAVTADGFIGRNSQHSADWTTTEDKKFFKAITKEAGAIVFGSRTYDTIGKPLPDRKTVIYTRQPEKYDDSGVLATNVSPEKLIETLTHEGYKSLAICGGQQIYDLFLQSGLVNEVYLTIEPILFGEGISLFSTPTEQKMSLVETKKLNSNTVLQHYKLI